MEPTPGQIWMANTDHTETPRGTLVVITHITNNHMVYHHLGRNLSVEQWPNRFEYVGAISNLDFLRLAYGEEIDVPQVRDRIRCP